MVSLFLKFRYQWRKVHLIYAPNGQTNFAGRHTCQLMMKSMAQSLKTSNQNINFGNFDVEALAPEEYPESLRTSIGNYYGGKSKVLLKIKNTRLTTIKKIKIIEHLKAINWFVMLSCVLMNGVWNYWKL